MSYDKEFRIRFGSFDPKTITLRDHLLSLMMVVEDSENPRELL